MAGRPIKEGLDYFSLDCILDTKLELIEAEYGLDGFGVVVKLYQKIYGQSGYYVEWKNEVALLFAKNIGLGGGVVSEIVGASIKWGVFDKRLFNKYNILTSAGIQKRYFDAVKRRKSLEVKKQYLLVDVAQIVDNDNINIIYVDINSKDAGTNTQSRVEESRVEESKYIVDFLNQEAGTKYRHSSKSTKKHINARLQEGYSISDFMSVISKKAKEWKGTEYEKYLCPDTLFGAKFEKYLNQPSKVTPAGPGQGKKTAVQIMQERMGKGDSNTGG